MQSNNNHTRDGVKLVVEDIEDKLQITYSDMSNREVWQFIVFLIDRVAHTTGQDYNQIVEDLKEIEEGEI